MSPRPRKPSDKSRQLIAALSNDDAAKTAGAYLKRAAKLAEAGYSTIKGPYGPTGVFFDLSEKKALSIIHMLSSGLAHALAGLPLPVFSKPRKKKPESKRKKGKSKV